MTTEIAWTTSTPEPVPVDDRKGWDAMDRMALWTFAAADQQTFSDVVRRLPFGIHFRVIRGALQSLVDAGYVTRMSEMGPWQITAAGASLLAERLAAQKAAAAIRQAA
jgi:hypothetical protein